MIFSQAPVHILIGELDDWVPASACTNLLGKLDQSGLAHNIDITIYENAHHSFDRVMESNFNGEWLHPWRLFFSNG